MIQPLFDYASTAWFPKLSKKLRLRLQTTQNKCMRFYLQLGKMSKICTIEFLELNWFNVRDRYLQFIVSDFLNFTTIIVLTILMKLFALLTIMVDDCLSLSRSYKCKVYRLQGLFLRINSPITLWLLPA